MIASGMLSKRSHYEEMHRGDCEARRQRQSADEIITAIESPAASAETPPCRLL